MSVNVKAVELFKDTYYTLLDSRMWKDFRREFLQKRNFTCEKCGKLLKVGLQVHHKRYYAGRKPWEYGDEDLQCLCVDCHRQLHLELIDRGRRIPVYDSDENPYTVPDEQCCRYCGGSGFKEEFLYLLGGICFHCFGTGIRYIHKYSPDEARRYSYRIFNQWLKHHEGETGEVDSSRFESPSDVERWLLSMNGRQ